MKDLLRTDDFERGERIGCGGCGCVYRAKDRGADWVVKVFDKSAISRHLLEKMTRRLEVGGWPAGVMRVISTDLEATPPWRLMPLVGDVGAGGALVPRCLQNQMDGVPVEDAWTMIKALAQALAEMHRRQVPHGNLKPGNVFFTDTGELLLSDWTLGNMPGIWNPSFTDAELYQPPEQLRNPDGYLEEAGYRWDVFAFGVLAYRLVTGRFPRCHAVFSQVAPEPGEYGRQGITADLVKVAGNLEAQPVVSWPDDAVSPLAAGCREWIDRCLLLDPVRRPFSMVEVAAGFGALDTRVALDSEREELLDKRRGAERRAWRNGILAGTAIAVAVLLGCFWQLANSRLEQQRVDRVADGRLRDAAEAGKVAAEAGKVAAEAGLAANGQALAKEREMFLERLEASRLTGDRLFSWALENGHRQLPPLDGREARLKLLEDYFTKFLTNSEGHASLAEERARARLQLAEISILRGNVAAAGKRLDEAREAWNALPVDAGMKMRLAADSLWFALLRQAGADSESQNSLIAARRALEAVPQAEVDADRLNQLLAILDFNEAKLLAAKGGDAKAMEQLLRASRALNHLSERRPDIAILRSDLAASQLAYAALLEGSGNPGDAREIRSRAAAELMKLLKNKPGDFALRLELAGCYGAMTESAVLAGDAAAAESNSKEALKMFDELLAERPDSAEAISGKAFQLCLRAGIQRDRGLSAEAMKDYQEGVRMLEALHASAPADAMASFRLAILWWQSGRMAGMAGRRDEELALLDKARGLFAKLAAAPSSSGPRAEQLRRSAAYLLGDRGHALLQANRKDDARAAFAEAITAWENLVKSYPGNEEYSDALAWCRGRLDELK